MPTTTTITEALAEIKTINARVGKKTEFLNTIIGRQSIVRDPFEAEGGATAKLASERQAVRDLQERLIRIRVAIQASNHATSLTVAGQTRTVAAWLTWRKEVAPFQKQSLVGIQQRVVQIKSHAQQQGGKVVDAPTDAKTDWVIHVDESALAKEIEYMETVLGTLDGALSLNNATRTIEIAD